MNAADVAVVLKLITATLPGRRIDERTPDVWLNACVSVDPVVAKIAADRLCASLSSRDPFPTPADFLEWVKAVKREREPLALPESTASPASREQVAQFLAACRQVAEAQRGAKHWHGGPNPCPVCASIPPPYGQVKATEAF